MDNKERLFGWYVIAAAWLGVFSLFGYRATFGVLRVPMSAEMGWTNTQVNLGYSLMMGIYAFAAFGSGFVVDRWGAKWLYALAAVLGALGFYVTAQTSSLYVYYMAFGLFAGIGTGGLWTGSIVSARNWFVGDSYARAWGIAFTGAPIAQIVLSLFIRNYISGGEVDAWRGAMVMLGGIILVLLVFATFLAKGAPETYNMKPAGTVPQATPQKSYPRKVAYTTYPFWGVVLVFFFSLNAEFQLWTQVVSYWINNADMSLSEATGTYVIIGATGIIAMPIMGIVADRVVRKSAHEVLGRKIMLIAGPLVGVVACSILLMQTPDTPIFGIVFCVVFAIYWAIVPGGVVGYLGAVYGRGNLGSIYSLVAFICMGGGPFIGPLVGGFLVDLSGGYTYSMVFSLVAFLISAVLALTLPLALKEQPAGVIAPQQPATT